MKTSMRLSKIEQHPFVQATARRERCKQLLSLPRKELLARIDTMNEQELDEIETFLGPFPAELDGIDFANVPDVALLALADKELTLNELKERYPTREILQCQTN